MKKALIFYLWGRKNAGDMAICLGAASLLIKNGFEVTFVSKFTLNQEDYYDSKNYIESYFSNVNVIPGIFELDRNKNFLQQFISYSKNLLTILKPKMSNSLDILTREADIICLNGGNLLRGNSLADYIRLIALFFPFRKIKKMNKKMIILPQSTAKSTKLGLKMLQNELINFDAVFVREEESFKSLHQKLNNINFVKSTDLAFHIEDNFKAEEKFYSKYKNVFSSNEKNIAFVFRSTTIGDLGEFSEQKKQLIADNITKFINKKGKDYQVFFVVQTEKDRAFTEYISSQVEGDNKIIIVQEHDTFVLREIYKQMDFVVAMRLHAAILSMTSLTPVIGYFDEGWGLKNPGIMNDIGMPWTYKGDDLEELSIKMINYLPEYKNKIQKFIDIEKNKIERYFN